MSRPWIPVVISLAVLSCGPALSTARAELIHAVAATGTGTFTNSASVIIDGFVPPDGTAWNGPTNVYWSGTVPQFTIDFGAVYTVADLDVSVDNNDTYVIEYSNNGTSFSNLTTIEWSYGNVPPQPGGMDRMTTFSTVPDYVPQIVFSPVQARYLRIFATVGDNFYSVGEVAPYGSRVIPEPDSIVLLSVAAVNLVAYVWQQRRKKR